MSLSFRDCKQRTSIYKTTKHHQPLFVTAPSSEYPGPPFQLSVEAHSTYWTTRWPTLPSGKRYINNLSKHIHIHYIWSDANTVTCNMITKVLAISQTLRLSNIRRLDSFQIISLQRFRCPLPTCIFSARKFWISEMRLDFISSSASRSNICPAEDWGSPHQMGDFV